MISTTKKNLLYEIPEIIRFWGFSFMSSYRMKYKIGATQYNIPVQEDISAIPLGTILPYSANSEYPPAGFLFCDGSAVSRIMYPDLFALIGTTFGNGDGETTFNLPNLTLGEFLEGSTTAGTAKSPGLPNISGSVGYVLNATGTSWTSTSQVQAAGYSGAFTTSKGGATNLGSVAVYAGLTNLYLDASRSSNIYGRSTTVQPKSVTVRYIIKAFNATTTSSELIDITNYASALNQKYDIGSDWCYIYPNNGTEQNPASISTNSRYVESNPFPGYLVGCQPEIYYNNKWGNPEWNTYYSSGHYGMGVRANQLDNGDIVIQTGNHTNYLMYTGMTTGHPFGTTDTVGASPCRVKVWKIGRLPS